MLPINPTPPWQIWHQWYKTARWQRRRRQQLRDQPLCAMCLQHGLVVPATIADHVHAHRGDLNAFWHGELQSLCKRCHDGPKLAHEGSNAGPIGVTSVLMAGLPIPATLPIKCNRRGAARKDYGCNRHPQLPQLLACGAYTWGECSQAIDMGFDGAGGAQ